MPKPFQQVVELTVVGRLHGQLTNNVWHFGGNGAEGNINQLILDVLDCIRTTLLPAVSEDWELTGCRAREIWPALKDPIEVEVSPAEKGTQLPAQASFVAYLIQLKTGLGGKSKRGRKYIAGAVENDVNLSRISDGALLKIAAFCLCMLNKFKDNAEVDNRPYELCVHSRKLAGGLLTSVEEATFPVQTMTPVREVASMRSRRIGHGT